MDMFRISFNISEDDLPKFITTVGRHLGKLTVHCLTDIPLWSQQGTTLNSKTEPDPEPAAEPEKPPRKRFSKVNAALLEALQDGPKTVALMKSALEQAGMSAGSLSTGIAALTKDGKIIRQDNGDYQLAA
jgi:predicted Rossmann fold nucleotide-binding protein DprA/Smf involved in DNA uptake